MKNMAHRIPLFSLIALLWFPATGLCRMEGSFTTLDDLIADSEYIVIATIEHKSPAAMQDGWVKYECRFIYWLKTPAPPLENPALAESWKVPRPPKPVPLYSQELNGRSQDYPPGAPRSNVVLLVDDHEKPYHRLDEGDRLAPAQTGHIPMYNHYHILFLCKDSEGKGYMTTGLYQSILPVSPLLDITKLPPEPHILDEAIADAQLKVKKKMSLTETIRFIVKDYIAFKEKELTQINKDLQEVLQDKVKSRADK